MFYFTSVQIKLKVGYVTAEFDTVRFEDITSTLLHAAMFVIVDFRTVLYTYRCSSSYASSNDNLHCIHNVIKDGEGKLRIETSGGE